MTPSRILITVSLTLVSVFIGYSAQRSRMCFIAGLRDFFLVRDRELLNGLIAFLLALWLLSSLAFSLGWMNTTIPEYGSVLTPTRSTQSVNQDKAESELVDISSQNRKPIIGIYPYAAGGKFLWVSIVGGILMGILTVNAGGCVLRQHVLAAQGSGDALWFIGGFYSAVVFYDLVGRSFIDGLYQ